MQLPEDWAESPQNQCPLTSGNASYSFFPMSVSWISTFGRGYKTQMPSWGCQAVETRNKAGRGCSERWEKKVSPPSQACSQSTDSKWCLGPLPSSPNVPNVPSLGDSPSGGWDKEFPLENSLLLPSSPSAAAASSLPTIWVRATVHVVSLSWQSLLWLPICFSFGLQRPRKTKL